MARVSLLFEDLPDGTIAFRADYHQGFDSQSQAHRLANQLIRWLDEQAASKVEIATTQGSTVMGEALRGVSHDLIAVAPSAERIARYGRREDGSPQGPGYFGEIAHAGEPEYYATEVPARMTPTDREIWVPLLVPDLTREEIAHLVDGGAPTATISLKARLHARARLGAAQSPFAARGEQRPLPEGDR